MPVSAGTAVLPVVPQLARDFSRQLFTQMAGPAIKTSERVGRESGSRFGKHFSGGLRTGIGPVRGVLRGFGPALAAAFGGAAIVAGIKSVTDEAREAAVVGRQTQAALKATGGAAHLSARQVGDLATALSNKVGVDDEAIQSAENLLLTFRGVRNETGKGRDIFNQASATIVDMTAAMNNGKVTAEGMKSSTIQVGKALNDPIKGITALTRVGVTFTDQQKKQITAMVKAGNTVGAQQIILKELRSEFGGAAAASADAGQRFGVFVGNLKEQIGTALLPILNRFLGFLVDKLPGAIAVVSGWFGKAGQGLRALGAAFRGEGVTSTGFVGVMEHIGVALRIAVFGVKALGAAFRGEGVTSTGFVGVMEHIGVALRAVVDWFIRTGRVAGQILGPAIAGIARALGPAIAAFVRGLLPGLKTLWHMIQTQLWPVLKGLGIVIGVVLYVALAKVIPFILRLAGPVLGLLIGTLAKAIGWITNIVRWLVHFGANVIVLGGKVTGVFNWIKGHWPLLLAILTGPIGAAVILIVRHWGRFRDVAVAVFRVVVTAFLDLASAIINGAARAFGWVPGLGGKLRGAATEFNKFRDRANAALAGIRDQAVDVTARTHVDPNILKVFTAAGGRVRLMAAGGRVTQGTSETADDVLIRASRNETVLSAPHSRLLAPILAAVGVPGYAAGGLLARGRGRLGHDVVPAYAGMRGRASGLMVASVKRALDLLDLLGVGGPADVRSVALWTLQALHRPLSELGAWMRRLMFESGGRADVVNRTDINWILGHPSVGIAQVIRGTFARWAGPYRNTGPFLYGVSTNPRANSYAGANYAIHRYGSLAAVDPRVRPIGYDSGYGVLPPGLSLSWNGLGRPETLAAVDARPVEVHIHLEGPVLGSARQVARELAPEIDTALRARGYQTGRRAGT